jgi:ketosteroid isomerase-like protein
MSRGTDLVRMIFPPQGRDLVEDSRLKRDAVREALGALLHPDFEAEWHIGADGSAPTPMRGVAKGFDAYWDRYQDLLDTMESYRITPENVIELEDGRVVIPSRNIIRARGGVELEFASGAIWKLEDGLIRRIDEYVDRAELYRDAGVEPPVG